jgi:hypothetical protein
MGNEMLSSLGAEEAMNNVQTTRWTHLSPLLCLCTAPLVEGVSTLRNAFLCSRKIKVVKAKFQVVL